LIPQPSRCGKRCARFISSDKRTIFPPFFPTSAICRIFPMTCGSRRWRRRKRYGSGSLTLQLTSSERRLRRQSAYVSLVVREYDERIAFFTQVLSFALVEDSAAIDREGNYQTMVSNSVLRIPRDRPAAGACVPPGGGKAALAIDRCRVFLFSSHRRFLEGL